jgi:CRP/FNR family cyclic AMP-dependent transcriptional regulator
MNTETEIGPDIRHEGIGTRVALHPFLVGMNRKHLALLSDCAINAHFNKGEVVLREAEQANRFYLIESGRVILESGKAYGQPVIIDTIGAGDLLGWSWMFPPYAWQFTARAAKATSAIFFYGTILREYCERDHSLGYELLKRITAVMMRRMQAARQKIVDFHASNVSLESGVVQSPFLDQELDTSIVRAD